MKILTLILVVLLPLHALLVTTLKCKFWIDTNILRFWKEIILAILFFATFFQTMKKYNWNFSRLYKNNYLLWLITTFVFFSAAFIFLPFLQPKLSGFLGFKYDVFFLVALTVWLYLNVVKDNLETILKILFIIVWLILSVFTPWYLFWDISTVTSIFGFSSEVSTYTANSCISFSQNVEGQHRFQWSFAWPIRWSVFLTVFYIIYLWFILNKYKNNISNVKKILNSEWFFPLLLIVPTILVTTSVFFSYSKTTILWLIIWILIFIYLTFKIKFWKTISKKAILIWTIIASIPIFVIAFIKEDLFLHLWSVLNRFDNILTSIEMFLYNPFGYWLWIAWPASWTGRSMESAWSWEIAIASSAETHKFLPENWFLQILLEQWLIWLIIFLFLMLIIWLKLYEIVKIKKDYLSIWIFTSYITLLIMANLTHAFEESATSYILFLIIWAYIAKYWKIKRKNI